MNSLFDNPARI